MQQLQQLDLKKILGGDDPEEGVNPVLNDRFEVKDLIKTTTTSKIYSGFDVATDNDVIIKFRMGRARETFLDGYSYLDEDMVPGLLWEETLGPQHVLVYEKKGNDVDTLYKNASNHFSTLTTGMILYLTTCALEKIHSKRLAHGNLRPTKILTNDNEDGHKLFITGFEFCERISRSANKIQKAVDTKLKKIVENIYSPISVHNHQSLCFKDDLESLGYICFNLFTDGKLFAKCPQGVTETNRKALVKLKTNIHKDTLLPNAPAEFAEYLKALSKFKPEDAPNYELLKSIAFKLCQRIYVKENEIIEYFDWFKIADDQKATFRARMLSYFFTANPNSKKIKPGKLDDILFSLKKNPGSASNTLAPDDYLKRNMQNMPILETQEEQNSTKYYLDGFKLDLDEEYSACPNTPRLATKDKAFISRPSKSEKHGSGSVVDDEKGSHKEIKEEVKEEAKVDAKVNGKAETTEDIEEEVKSQVREVRQEIFKSHEEIKEHKETVTQAKPGTRPELDSKPVKPGTKPELEAKPLIKPEPVEQEKAVPSSESIKSLEDMDSQPNVIRENPPKTNKDILALKLTFTEKGPMRAVPMSKDVLPTSKDKDKEKLDDLIRSKSDGSTSTRSYINYKTLPGVTKPITEKLAQK